MSKHKHEGHWYIEYADGFFLYRALGIGTHSHISNGEVISYEVYGVGEKEPLLYPYASDRYNLDNTKDFKRFDVCKIEGGYKVMNQDVSLAWDNEFDFQKWLCTSHADIFKRYLFDEEYFVVWIKKEV